MSTKVRKDNCYRITIEEIGLGDQAKGRTVEFELQDREDLFKIVDSLKQASGLEPSQATKVGVALRLLGPVMMGERKHPLFEDFMPHFKTFMQHLKNTVKGHKAADSRGS
ncbi:MULTISPECIES: DUF3861 domain-containing protein [unclassified Shewanella]|uniref:DUF3861 domain-containing protein n=1 Tax=unclassified Shewanella TaxID=196818 RepID=UPI001BC6E82E|nr:MULTISPECIES: DUF3861 domain-containing protein [unclassified Shewanella]GIU05141.1 hypothetical protein TUM4444_01010 [Shewanella sp. MBTL60-112-B1]GIU24351.1 hypothetical protein TUM4445_01360 [Shewanella sp. MBTL60-112-B2]